ncbi:hypothetical protein MPLSOD_110118 [Mesorhizobium sp. SOD10]|nr:hypothetical protein MPLSOD_110118 [Mesorhizobium sp. SOD10]
MMMAVQLSSLRVSAELDASKYVVGAQQIASATAQASAGNAALAASVTSVQAKISAAGDPVERLSRQFVDGYAATQRMSSAFNTLGRAIDTGKVSMQQADKILDGILAKYRMVGDASQFIVRGQNEMAAAIGRANTRFLEQNNRVPANNNARLSSGQIQNLSFQANDILTMALMGASPGQIAVSQGGQIVQALQMGEGGIVGSLNAIKASAAAAGSALVGTLGLVGSIATGFGVAAVAAGAFYALTRDKSKDLNEALKDQKQAIDEVAKAYDLATVSSDNFNTSRGIYAGAAARQSQTDLGTAARSQDTEVLGELARFVTAGQVRGGRFGYVASGSYQARPEFSAFNGPIATFARDFDYDELAKGVRDITTQNPALQVTGDKILNIAKSGHEAAAALKEGADALARINSSARSSVGFDRIQQFGRDQMTMTQRFGDDPFAAQREEQRQKVISLKEAQDERNRSLDRTLDLAQLDVALTGKTTPEATGFVLRARKDRQ